MLVYGISVAQAFAMLKWRSQTTNSKVRVLAEKLATDLPCNSAPSSTTFR